VHVHNIMRNISDSIVATWHAKTSCKPLLLVCVRACARVMLSTKLTNFGSRYVVEGVFQNWTKFGNFIEGA